MRPHVRSVAVVLLGVAAVLLAAGFGFGLGRWSLMQSDAQWLSGRTYYESLDLASPEAAVHELCAAFRRRDYATVYLALAPGAHFMIAQHFALLRYDHLVQDEHEAEIMGELCVVSEGVTNCDYVHDYMFWFDDLMLGAEKHSAFLVDLSGRVTIEGVGPQKAVDEQHVVDVTATVEGIEGGVVFRTVQVPVSGKWRVLQVIVPGGNDELIPWSVPNAE